MKTDHLTKYLGVFAIVGVTGASPYVAADGRDSTEAEREQKAPTASRRDTRPPTPEALKRSRDRVGNTAAEPETPAPSHGEQGRAAEAEVKWPAKAGDVHPKVHRRDPTPPVGTAASEARTAGDGPQDATSHHREDATKP